MAEASLKKQQMEYIVVACLVLAALFLGLTRFKKKDIDDEVFSRSEFNKKWKEVEEIEANVPQEEKESISYTIDDERAPFMSPFDDREAVETIEVEIVLPSMTFQGMIWNSRRPQVIINNKIYDIGDSIKGTTEEEEIKIKDIRKEGVYVRYKGKDFIVKPK